MSVTLTLDPFVLKVLREGRREGARTKVSLWLPFEIWLDVVRQLLPDERRAMVVQEAFWKDLWTENKSPIEAIIATAAAGSMNASLPWGVLPPSQGDGNPV